MSVSPTLAGRTGVLTLLGAITEGVGLMLLLPLINVISKAGFGSGLIDQVAASAVSLLPAESALGQLAILLIIFSMLMTIRAWAILRRDVSVSRLQTAFVESLRIRVVDAMSKADWGVLTRIRHGRVSHILSNDIRNCGLAAHLTLQSMIATAMLSIQMILAVLLSPAVALLVFALLAGGALLLRPTLRRSRLLGSELTESNFRLTDDTNQFLGGLKLAFSQNLQGGFAHKFRQNLIYGAHREVAFARQRALGQIALTSLAAVVAGTALLLGFGIFATSPPALIALLVILGRMSGPTGQIQQNLQYIAHSLPAYEEILRLEDELASERWNIAEAKVLRTATVPIAGNVAFADVTFSHAGPDHRSSGVTELSFALRRGELIGVSGASGAGKTTLVDLLVGLLIPASGQITVDGMPLDGVLRNDWRNRLSYVSQDPYLFNDTVAGNLRWARPDADEEAIWHSLMLAGADRFVADLPHGLETIVGERGTLLSGGERQRIALARALIREPTLLILDEATNAIDVTGERLILDRLASLTPRPTIVMVAHREQSLEFCERLITLEAGRLVDANGRAEFGTLADPAPTS